MDVPFISKLEKKEKYQTFPKMSRLLTHTALMCVKNEEQEFIFSNFLVKELKSK